MKQDILSDIIRSKRREIARQKQAVPTGTLRLQAERALKDRPARRSMRHSLETSPTGIIAEFKRRSPSKGWIHPDADPTLIAPAYGQAGAAALSILTDEPFFGGTLADLAAVRRLVSLPLLRKDFIIDPYQLLQACLAGADAVLLIAACLTPEESLALTEEAHALGMEVLLEVHTEEELEHLTPATDMVGVNNRNLGTFHTDVQNSLRMAEALQRRAMKSGQPLAVSESGIGRPDTIVRLRRAGFRGFLIGETFMKADQPAEALRLFTRQILQP